MNVIIDGVKYAPVFEAPTGEGVLDALNVRLDCDAGENITIRDFLCKLLVTLWDEGEEFNSKRPFGTGGWEFPLYKALVKAGFIKGTFDEDGYLKSFCSGSHDYVRSLILAAFYGTQHSID